MALQLKDRVSSGCTATGTNDIVFGDDTPSFHNWSVVDNGSTVYYCIVDKDDFEVGQGVKSTSGITRDTIFTSSNGDAKINLSGNADVFLTYPADKAVAKDENGNLIIDGTITATEVYADNLTLEGLGIANHEKIIVDTNGVISGDGGGLTNLNIDLADNGLANHDKITVDELGNIDANSISIDTSLGYPNGWSVTGQPTSFNVSKEGANKVTVSDAGVLTATSLSGALNGSDLVDASVTNAKLVDKTVTGAKIADNTVTPTQLNVSGNGANDQILASSGNGAMKWVAPSAGGTWEKIASSGTASGAQSVVKFDNFTGYKYVKVYCTLRSFTSGTSNRQPRLRFINSGGGTHNANYFGGVNGLSADGAHMATNTGNNGDSGKLVLDSGSNLPMNSAMGTFCEFYMKVGTYPVIFYNMVNFGQWNNSTGYGFGKINGFIGAYANTACRGFQIYDATGNTVGWLDYYIEGLKV
jgi:hypothetical protein